MPVTKGRSGPNIGSHGSGSVAISDVSSSLQDNQHASSVFKPDPGPSVDPGPKVFKFP